MQVVTARKECGACHRTQSWHSKEGMRRLSSCILKVLCKLRQQGRNAAQKICGACHRVQSRYLASSHSKEGMRRLSSCSLKVLCKLSQQGRNSALVIASNHGTKRKVCGACNRLQSRYLASCHSKEGMRLSSCAIKVFVK